MNIEKVESEKKPEIIPDKPEVIQPDKPVELSPEESAKITTATESYLKSLEPEKKPDPIESSVEIPADVQEKLNKLNFYEQNPLITSFAEFINGGGDVNSLIIKPSKDYDSMTEDDILKEYLLQNVYSTEEEKSKIPTVIAEFKKQSDLDRVPKVRTYREELKKKNPPIGGEAWNTVFGSKLTEINKSNQLKIEERAYQENVLKATYSKVADKVKSLKEFNGIPILDNQRDELISLAYAFVPASGKGKSLKTDPDKGVENALILKYQNEIRKSERAKGFADGMKQYLRPSIESVSHVNTQEKTANYKTAMLAENNNSVFKKVTDK